MRVELCRCTAPVLTVLAHIDVDGELLAPVLVQLVDAGEVHAVCAARAYFEQLAERVQQVAA